MTHTQNLDITDPADTDKEGLGAQSIRETLRDFQERMEVDHNFDKASTDDDLHDSDGTHKKVTLDNSVSVSAAIDNSIILHSKDVGTIAELFAMTEPDDVDVQVTSEGATLYPALRYSYASDSTARLISSTSWADDANMDLTITVKENDIVIVNFIGTMEESYTGAFLGLYSSVKFVLKSGDAIALLSPNIATITYVTSYSNQTWSCQAIYQATADGDLVFRNQVKKLASSSAMANNYLKNRNAIAYVVNRS